MDENQGLELTPENVDTVLDEIRCGHCLRGSLLVVWWLRWEVSS